MVACGGASADILDASDDGTLESSADVSAIDATGVDASSEATASDASKAADAFDGFDGYTCTPLGSSGLAAPAVGCQCLVQSSCTLGTHGCAWFVGYVNSSCTTGCTFFPVDGSAACEACAETYDCACVAPLMAAVNPKCTCHDSDAGPYCQ